MAAFIHSFSCMAMGVGEGGLATFAYTAVILHRENGLSIVQARTISARGQQRTGM